MTTLESQLRSALADEAHDAPSFPDLAERVRAEAGRTARRRRVRTSALVAGVAATAAAVAILPSLRAGAPPPTFGPYAPATASGATVAGTGAVAALCSGQDDALADPGHLPAGLGQVTAGYTCWTGTRAVPGGGTWQFREVRKVTEGLAAALRAYAVPDVRTPPGTACAAVGYLRKVLVVEVDGRVRAVREPVIACGAPLQSAVDAYGAMTTEVVSSVRLQQVASPLAVASGCPQQVKDTIALLATMRGHSASTQPPTLPAAAAVTACVYSADPDLTGTLTAATRLRPAEYEQTRALMSRASVDPACATTPHTRFAVLVGSGLPWTEIALDGCGVDQGAGVHRAPADLASLLLSALKHQVVVG